MERALLRLLAINSDLAHTYVLHDVLHAEMLVASNMRFVLFFVVLLWQDRVHSLKKYSHRKSAKQFSASIGF